MLIISFTFIDAKVTLDPVDDSLLWIYFLYIVFEKTTISPLLSPYPIEYITSEPLSVSPDDLSLLFDIC